MCLWVWHFSNIMHIHSLSTLKWLQNSVYSSYWKDSGSWDHLRKMLLFSFPGSLVRYVVIAGSLSFLNSHSFLSLTFSLSFLAFLVSYTLINLSHCCLYRCTLAWSCLMWTVNSRYYRLWLLWILHAQHNGQIGMKLPFQDLDYSLSVWRYVWFLLQVFQSHLEVSLKYDWKDGNFDGLWC